MKHCPVCKSDKELDQFWKGQYCCIECQKISENVLKKAIEYLNNKRSYTLYAINK